MIVEQVMKHCKPAGLPMSIALSCAGQLRAGGEPLLAAFLSAVPPEVSHAWKSTWRHQIEAEMAYVDSICLDQDDEPPFDVSTLFPIPNS